MSVAFFCGFRPRALARVLGLDRFGAHFAQERAVRCVLLIDSISPGTAVRASAALV